jgi:hypothetical protein
VTVAKDGVAVLPNGFTVTLKCLYATSTGTPAWDITGKDVPSPVAKRGGQFDSPYGKQTMDRTLWFVVDSPRPGEASVMSYVTAPSKPDVLNCRRGSMFALSPGQSVNAAPFHVGEKALDQTLMRWWVGHMQADCMIDAKSELTEPVSVPRVSRTGKMTYRLGIGSGEWKSVLDYPNPFYVKSAPRDSKDPFDQATLIVYGKPEIYYGGKSHYIPVAGEPSNLIPRRALVLDAGDNLIGVLNPSGYMGMYQISGADLRECRHIVVQERDMYWAEFRDVPLRPAVK